jgi:hypothetical protein
MRRAAFVAVLAFFAMGFSLAALRVFSPSLFHESQATPDRQQLEASRSRLLDLNEEALLAPATGRPVYPYSLVPGGIEDARELKWVAEHDPVVAAHYAGFDYDHARTVRLVLARTVVMSYRIGNRVYWTRHRVKLQKGEKVITDGKMIARARCANRVEEVPQQATSESEPPVAKFDMPEYPIQGTAAQTPPVAFQSALLSRPAGPGSPLGLTTPFTGGNWVPIAPPPLPGGSVCAPGKKGEIKDKKKVCVGPTPVPEPGTWLLVASGLLAMYWFGRRRRIFS